MEPDFSGYATKTGLKCSDGRTIMPDAFKHQDQMTVPLVWAHGHKEPDNVLGHAVLTNVEDGVRCDAYFNNTEKAQAAKETVIHKDITFLSIYANQLVERSKQVFHGMIREVSLVLAGANPGARIDYVAVQHSDDPEDVTVMEEEAVIYTGLEIELAHDDDGVSHAEDEQTVRNVYDSMSKEQQTVVHFMIGAALENDNAAEQSAINSDDATASDDSKKEGDLNHKEGNDDMSHNVFDRTDKKNEPEGRVLSHDDMQGIMVAAKQPGQTLRTALEGYALEHGIENLESLFPDPKLLSNQPEWDKRRTEWVAGVLNGTRKSPFSRVKTVIADITMETARARGYVKGNLKKEEWFRLSKRTTGPTTVYKKQKLDRDDIIDITDLDIVVFMKGEMRLMLEEELARAILIGDGRPEEDPAAPGEPNPDKIKDPAAANDGSGVRSILHEHELYAATVYVNIDDVDSSYSEVVDEVLRARRLYKGTGTPDFYTTEETITSMLLLRDAMGRRLYRTVADLASELRVSSIVAVEPMEDEVDLVGILVNLTDYNIGADKGGEVNFFDDFDIDYNQFKYLYETRVSGALVKIRSALIIKKTAGGNVLVAPIELAFIPATNTIDWVAQTGVDYQINGVTLIADAVIAADTVVTAVPQAGYYFANNVDDEWFYEFTV